MRLEFSAAGALVVIDAPQPVGELFAAAFVDLLESGPVRSAVGGRLSDLAEPLHLRVFRHGRRHWRLDASGRAPIRKVDLVTLTHECMIAINAHVAARRGVADIILHAAAFVREIDGIGHVGQADSLQPQRTAVAVCGASGAGKSTFAAAAVLQGHHYLADEVCSIDPMSMMVAPYHRPIGLRPRSAAMLGLQLDRMVRAVETADTRDLDSDDSTPWPVSSGGHLATSLPLGLVAILDRDSDPAGDSASAVEIEWLPPSQALVRLVGFAIPAVGIERETFRRIERLVRDVPVAVVRYRDCREAVRLLVDSSPR